MDSLINAWNPEIWVKDSYITEWTDYMNALKIPMGWTNWIDWSLSNQGNTWQYWTSSSLGAESYFYSFGSNYFYLWTSMSRKNWFSIRCFKN